MVTKYEYCLSVVQDSELNELLAGRRAGGIARPWDEALPEFESARSGTGVLWRHTSEDRLAQPMALIVREAELRRLFGRFSQLRSDLSPLTTWCHLLSPSQLKHVDSLTLEAGLDGWEAAWTGLIVAEALLLSERSIAKLRLTACQATQSFAVGRALALWGNRSVPDLVERFHSMQRVLRTGDPTITRLRAALQPLWRALVSATSGDDLPAQSELAAVGLSLCRLRELREAKSEHEAQAFIEPLRHFVPEVLDLADMEALGPEQRLARFDSLVSALGQTSDSNATRRTILALLAGYVATVAAGGAPSLGLADRHVSQWPEITAWAYLVGGIGERVVWTASFDGLGRLVARELMRPLRLDEPPTCDFALDEAQVLVDPKLQDPLVHLRTKQARVLSVSLLPGVNVFVSVPESPVAESKRLESDRKRPGVVAPAASEPAEQSMANLAEGIWPHLRGRVEQLVAADFEKLTATLGTGKKPRKKDSPKGQSKLWVRE